MKEFSGIRTGAASIAILDNVKIEAYGSMMPINQLANLGIQDSKTIMVSPFDTSIAKDLERGLNEANLGLSVAGTSDGVRLSFPDLTSERRVMLLKLAKEKLENGKISLRKERDET
jgi:ribosome recycling factor